MPLRPNEPGVAGEARFRKRRARPREAAPEPVAALEAAAPGVRPERRRQPSAPLDEKLSHAPVFDRTLRRIMSEIRHDATVEQDDGEPTRPQAAQPKEPAA